MKKIIMATAICLVLVLIVVLIGVPNDKTVSTGSARTNTFSTNNSAASTSTSSEPYDVYPHDLTKDRKSFDASKIDIVVGDKLYMTQINDWYMNFADYEGKSVEIEGYFLIIDKYFFVGRNGPTCPYCMGGYVDFEFYTDQDVSGWVSEKTWIKVTGILRQGLAYPGGGKGTPGVLLHRGDQSGRNEIRGHRHR